MSLHARFNYLHAVVLALLALGLFGCSADLLEGERALLPDAPTLIEDANGAAATETAYPTDTEESAPSADANEPDSAITPQGRGAGPQPGVDARIRLVEDPYRILDFRHDRGSGRLFATTTDGRLTVLDGSTFDTIKEFPFGGELTMDEDNRRLYAAPGSQYIPDNQPITVHVIDMDSLDVVGQIEEAHYVSLDTVNGRLYAGSPVRSFADERDADTVRVYDLNSLEFLYEIDQQGIPAYNPFRDELLITAYTVLVIDPVTGKVLDDLLPELSEQPFTWCNGCEYANGAHILEPEGLLVIERSVVSTGGGPGFDPADLYLDATTLQEPNSFARRYPFQAVCSTRRIPLKPMSGKVIWQPYYVRYVVFRNFNEYNTDGELETWRDGLFAPYINPRTHQAYTSQGYVLDLDSLTPIGRLPSFCTLDEDAELGRIFGRIDGDLVVIDENGGAVVTAVPTEPEPLPAVGISQILISPDYPVDPTVFLLLEDARLYRTSDEGDTWMRVQGGLPSNDNLTLNVKLSPDFGSDRTMFAGGFVRDYRGEGVLRSDDAGMTWQPLWNGLNHLRVYDIQLSPNYAEDGAVRALARYTRLSPWESGVSLHVSTDRGLTWSQTLTATNESDLDALLASEGSITAEALPVRIVGYGSAIEVKDEEGEWRQVDLRQKDGETVRAVVPSPRHEQDATYYALGDYSLWRTADSGQTWSRWADPRLGPRGLPRDYTNALTALAVTPQFPDGSYRLLVGTYAGEFWMLSPVTDIPAAGDQTGSDRDSGNEQDDESATPAAATAVAPVSDFTETQPPDGKFLPGGALASVWEASPDTRASLGWAMTELSTSIPAAFQTFERGAMLWNGGSQSIIVLNDDGTWESFPDTFSEEEPEFDPTLNPPEGKLQPIRGFGKLWRDSKAVRDRLGWALQEEHGYTAYIHEFERGYLVGSPAGTLVLVRESESGGRWR